VPGTAPASTNSTYDRLSKEYVAAVDLSSQRSLAKQIENLLLDENTDHLPLLLQLA